MAIDAQDRIASVLAVAGSDSSGGAGLSRDIATIAQLGLSAAVAVTAVTAQTDRHVLAVETMPPHLVARQMETALEARDVRAIKIGMLATRPIVEAVTSVLKKHPAIPVVLDPVLAASSGKLLLEADALGTLKHELMPLCPLVTPNWIELAVLCGSEPARCDEEAIAQGHASLHSTGCSALLVKGGHSPDQSGSTDILLRKEEAPLLFNAPRVNAELRGSGCRLSSAIAAMLASGKSLEDSISEAKDKLLAAYRAAALTHAHQ
ncbi:hydroxymethylpyrimidine/phosphomethylpyrimidine kinase [Chelativorans sp. Marseille-P2723]|uniref:hydroxymethylpyrimidine/phosphomethylpyrimidine kinase n=1 Tax=Chelativorans sp. Marseille-P2723 TaxID=2709133 RepID=UPI001FF02C8F|nr:hydroxymethylpyrimidine/phosphomethylpyrimidine kinase [Chelativorans sp. Marseille-P2723]